MPVPIPAGASVDFAVEATETNLQIRDGDVARFEYGGKVYDAVVVDSRTVANAGEPLRVEFTLVDLKEKA